MRTVAEDAVRPEHRAEKLVTQIVAGGEPTRFICFHGVRSEVEVDHHIEAAEVVRELRFAIAGEIRDAVEAEKSHVDSLEKKLAGVRQANASLRIDLARKDDELAEISKKWSACGILVVREAARAAEADDAVARERAACAELAAEAERTISSLRLELQLERAKVQSLTSVRDEMIKASGGNGSEGA